MIIKTKPLKTLVLETEYPLKDFKCIERNRDKNLKQVVFCRYIGMNTGEDEYINQLRELQGYFNTTSIPYIIFTKGLNNRFNNEEIEYAKQIWDQYIEIEKEGFVDPTRLYTLNLGEVIEDECLEWTKKQRFIEILKLFDTNNQTKGLSARKNFGVKLILWMNQYFKNLFQGKENNKVPKVIFYGDIKRHEFYFLTLLSKLGCDILYINPKEDILLKCPEVVPHTTLYKCKNISSKEISFPQYIPPVEQNRVKQQKVEQPTVERPQKPIVKQQPQNRAPVIEPNENIEKTYEELAKLSESVVMIKVYDNTQKVVSGGSGVVISRDGFIVTNFHVVNHGVAYGVIFENDSKEYMSYNLIKYHPDYDLALIKIDRQTKPIPIKSGKALIRGQKVVAIGSPLGLFNTISDGIVSGFREVQDVHMVQITAPISPGSSGGALINMYGHLVGITTAGYEGQNLNLAVPVECVKGFANNILTR